MAGAMLVVDGKLGELEDRIRCGLVIDELVVGVLEVWRSQSS